MLLEIKIKPRGSLHLFPPAIFQQETRAHVKKLADSMVQTFQVNPISFWLNFHEICWELPLNILDKEFEVFYDKLKTFFKQELYTLRLLRDACFIIEVSNSSKKAVIFHDDYESALGAIFKKYNKPPIVSRMSGNPLDNVFHDCAASGNLEDLQQVIQFIGDIDTQDAQTHQRTALHSAILGGHATCVRLLLERSARLDVMAVDRLTPFDYQEQNPNAAVRAVISDYVSTHFKIKWEEFISFVHIQFELCDPHQQSAIKRLYLAINYACMNDEFRTKKFRYLFNKQCTIVLFVDLEYIARGDEPTASYHSDVNMIFFDRAYLESPFTKPHSLTRTFAHECEHGFQYHQGEFLHRNDPSFNKNLPKKNGGISPFYPWSMAELRKVVASIKEGDQRLQRLHQVLHKLIAGEMQTDIPTQRLYDLEKVCSEYLSDTHRYSAPHYDLLKRFNMSEATREQIQQILPQACDTAGNVVNLDLVLENLEDIVNRRKYPLKMLFTSYPLITDGEAYNLILTITEVLATSESINGEKNITVRSDQRNRGIACARFDTLQRYVSVNQKNGFDSLRQCIEQHAAVMGEYPDTVLQQIYPELYNYSLSLAKRVFAGDNAHLSDETIQHDRESKNQTAASIHRNPHNGLMKHLAIFRDASNEIFFESLERGNYSQALRRLCTWKNPKLIQVLSTLLAYKNLLVINLDEQAGDKQQAAIHLAAQCNNEKAVNMLIAAGASAALRDKSGQTPADYLAMFKVPPQSSPGNAPTSDASIRALTDSSARLSAISSRQPSAEVNSEKSAASSVAITTTTTTITPARTSR